MLGSINVAFVRHNEASLFVDSDVINDGVALQQTSPHALQFEHLDHVMTCHVT